MREKIGRFMQGRYGQDQLNQFLMVLMLVSGALSLFVSRIFYYIAMIIIVAIYFRMLSKNKYKRSAENAVYLKYFNKVKYFFQDQKKMMGQRKTHHIFHCPSCSQKIRIPKGKGKIVITCPKCGTQFNKKS
ncbi:MAG: hypothetical protein WBI07_09940 [Mobilitalea sp.]